MSAGQSRRSWGWHPLTDRWACTLVAGAGVGEGDLVLDLGAGTGSLTAPLLQAGADVIAVELHRGRAERLRARFGHADNFRLMVADAADLRLPRRPFQVVASPPYSSSSAIVRALLARDSRLLRADLVVQRQFARRVTEGGLTVRGGGRFTAEVARPLPRSAFRPPPRVDSVVLRISRHRATHRRRPRRA
ncbi:methyltransferase domain-containing protein [Nocardioides rotundus]|uniref:rRNA adenine N-6-methyltransferase family protein n=1 Tax=Nocardioides rotundus TaxID=1774216 RepID=UPI001CBD3541|nr:rRNA adenine N-6-methyltransferase family protein [Nocardioides rotundus]UAL29020.1 methyltransferase domain-containing protein [Nocardioides rotundus]